MKTFKDIIVAFWCLFFKLQDKFEKGEVEKVGNRWGQDKEHSGLIDTLELNEDVDNMSGDVGHDILHSVLFKRLKEAEERLDLLYEMEDLLNKALVLKRAEATDEWNIGGSVREETKEEGKKAKSLLNMIEGQIDYWQGVHKGLLAEDEADPDNYTTNDGGYNNIHWGEAIRRGEAIVAWAFKCNDIKKLFDGMKRIDALRNKRHITYKHWIKIRYIINVQIMRNATSENMKNKAMHFAIMSRVALAKKEAEDKKKEVKEREPVMVELGDVCGSYSINIEDALDKYHAAKKLADKNGVDVREMADMLDEEQELSPVESMLTTVVDALNACDGVKAKAARQMGITIHKFNSLLKTAINVQKTYYNN
jgi:hypothetical protein